MNLRFNGWDISYLQKANKKATVDITLLPIFPVATVLKVSLCFEILFLNLELYFGQTQMFLGTDRKVDIVPYDSLSFNHFWPKAQSKWVTSMDHIVS